MAPGDRRRTSLSEDREKQEALDLFRSAPPFSVPQLFSSRFPPSMAYSLCFCGFIFVDLISMASYFVISISLLLLSHDFLCGCFHILILWWSCPAVCPCLRRRMHLTLLIYFLALWPWAIATDQRISDAPFLSSFSAFWLLPGRRAGWTS